MQREEVIASTAFRTDKAKYQYALLAITICAEEYRHNFDIECKLYFDAVTECDPLLKALLQFIV